MPFCPECQAEYRQGFTRCASCDVDLVEELPKGFDMSEENIQKAMDGKQLVPVIRGGDFEVAKEVHASLAAAGIASLLLDDEEFKVPAGAPKRVMLVVGDADEEDARRLMSGKFMDMIAEEGLEVDSDLTYGTCPACGHEIGEDQEECPECGLTIGKA